MAVKEFIYHAGISSQQEVGNRWPRQRRPLVADGDISEPAHREALS